MCVLGLSEPVGSVLKFPCGYDTLEYCWVKATAVSVHLRILFVTLQNTNTPPRLKHRLNRCSEKHTIGLTGDEDFSALNCKLYF